MAPPPPGAAGPPLPLASLRLLASPLQLAYAHVWQVIQRRSVGRYGKVEEFVAMVTWTVPELMSAKQTAQLVLGLRARIILELVKEATPDCAAIQALVNKLKVPAGTDVDVERSQTNFMVLIQILLKNPAERDRFFQALIAGLVYKLEQLLPVPNLSQVAHLRLGTMLPSQPSVLEECGHFMPDRDDLTALLRHQKQKGFLTTSAISTTVGDCVLSSLSFLPDPLEPAGTQQAEEPRAPDPEPAAGRPENPGVEEEEAGGEATVDRADNVDTSGGTDACDGPAGLTPDIGRDVQEILSSAVAHSPAGGPPGSVHHSGGGGGRRWRRWEETRVMPRPRNLRSPPATRTQWTLEGAVALLETATVLAETETANRQPLLIERPIPFRVVHVPIRSAPSAVAGVPEGEGQQRPQIQRVTLHQWVSQMASNSLSLPTLPPLSPPRAGDTGGGGGGGGGTPLHKRSYDNDEEEEEEEEEEGGGDGGGDVYGVLQLLLLLVSGSGSSDLFVWSGGRDARRTLLSLFSAGNPSEPATGEPLGLPGVAHEAPGAERNPRPSKLCVLRRADCEEWSEGSRIRPGC
ncbi:hypothetical protein CRUP_013134 [Coryphaenoides rupestris]|nr:hypothetical protein CRUP_013134 [Coryphaenoides rupestris]